MLHFTYHEEKPGKPNKMGGMMSLNTSSHNNPFCVRMHGNKKSVCRACYSWTLEAFYEKQLAHYLISNGDILSTTIMEGVPILDRLYCRFNSFGELLNKTHYHNLLGIVDANPQTTFALWTKRLDIVKNPAKRDNLIYIYSSPIKNVEARLPKGFDKVFTVYSKPFIRENAVAVNCAKHCKTCLLCYTKNNTAFIKEEMR